MRGKTLRTGGRYPVRRRCRHLATLYICLCMCVCVCMCLCVHRYVSVKERERQTLGEHLISPSLGSHL